jgi:hypothetical protein
MTKSRSSARGAHALGSRRHTRSCAFFVGLLFTLPLNVIASPFCSAAAVYCWFDAPPGQFEWPGAGLCKTTSEGLYEFCLLPSPEPAKGREAILSGAVVRLTLNKSPIPLSYTATEIFWRLTVVAWLTVSVVGVFLLSRTVVRKRLSKLNGTLLVVKPARLSTTLAFVGTAGTAMVIAGGAYQLHRLVQVEIALENSAVAQSEAQTKCQRRSGTILPNGEVNFKVFGKGNPCTTKSDTYAKLDQNAKRIWFVRDWTRPVALTLFLLFCSPWLLTRAFQGSRKSIA